MNRLYRFVVRNPRTVIVVTLAVTFVFGLRFFTHRVRLDGSPETLSIKSDQTAKFYDQARRDFGDDRVILVVVESNDLFTPDKISRLRALTRQLENMPGVVRAIGITTVDFIRNEEDTIKVANLVPRDADAEQLAKIRDEIVSDPLFRKQLISADGRTTAINLILRDELDDGARRGLARSVEATVDANKDWTTDIFATGEPIMQLHGTLSMHRDLFLFIPITVGLIMIVFYVSFKSWRGVLLPLATVAMAVVWTLGLMSFLGRSLTVVTLSLPVVILAIGSSYVIHVINQYYISTSKLSQGEGVEERRRAVFDAMAFIRGPVLVSGTITMAGFLSLATVDIQGSREMGFFAAFGMLAATILSLSFAPAMLVMLKTPSAVRGHGEYATYLDGILWSLGHITTERQRLVYLVTALLCVSSLAGFSSLQVNTDYRAFFKKSSPVYQGAEKLHDKLAGGATFELIINGENSGAMLQPQTLQAMQHMQKFALESGADATLSIADFITALNKAVTGNKSASLPEDKLTVDNLDKDYLSQDENAGSLITKDRSSAVILIRTNYYSSTQMRDFLSRIETQARTLFPQSFKINSTGIFVLLNHASDAVATDQARSLTVAMLLILVMVTVLFRSFRLGLVAMVPNLIPILFTFGFMGWFGINLDINTSLVASIVLGLAVDNAVHFIVRFVRNRALSSGNKEAVILSLMQSGKPIIFANLTLVFAFAIFILSQFNPIQLSGLLSSVAIFACMIGNLILLPALLTWDVWRLKESYSVPVPRVSGKLKQRAREEEIELR